MAVKKSEKIKKETKEMGLEKTVPTKTYIAIGLVVLGFVLLGVYIYKWYEVKNAEKLQESYLISSTTLSLEIKNLEEVEQILTEAPSEYFILISYTNDKDTYDLEKGLKSIIDRYSLSDRFYYLDVTSIMKEDNYLERINNAFNTDKITKVPAILYYKDGTLAPDGVVLRDDDNPINAGDFQKLLDIYDYEDQ